MSGCRIFIGRLSPSAREKDVERFFKGYGRIRDIDLKRGFGFVEFDDPRDAEDAVYELDGKELCNERVTIEHARVRLRGGRGRGGGGAGGRFSDRYGRGSQNSRSRNPPPMRTENRLIVENLSSRVSWQVSIATCFLYTASLYKLQHHKCYHLQQSASNNTHIQM
ncbi:serine and arginine rich splicing factor 5b isoform X1 [Epinephelus moara]|uniref:serine and arginine rich splicing factor 5b isoform X1 n=1 Tax=Epinephelus moara TaxID=300413 RepID=UPI00214EEF39|nr:serine and arginine rich splicing factor 5b isoform X1 [Epinephelus moara]